MREIKTHIVEGDSVNSQLQITDIGRDVAHHYYRIYDASWSWDDGVLLDFQNGPIEEVGINGITNEALLAIILDRLEGFQKGPFACDENQIAVIHIQSALEALKERTADRIKRGVEGTHQQ